MTKTIRFNMMLDEEDSKMLFELAETDRVSRAEVMRKALRLYWGDLHPQDEEE